MRRGCGEDGDDMRRILGVDRVKRERRIDKDEEVRKR